MSKPIVLIGAGGHAASIADAVISSKSKLIGFVDEARSTEEMFGYKIYSSIEEIENYLDYEYCVAIGDNFLRSSIVEKTIKSFPKIKFTTIIHSSSYVSKFAKIECGTVILGNAFVGPRCILSNHCIVNTGSVVDHDCSIGQYSSIGPGSVLGGTVRIGKCSAISIGAVIKHSLNIGNDSVIGGNSYLNEDVGDLMIYYGVPAKFISKREINQKYL